MEAVLLPIGFAPMAAGTTESAAASFAERVPVQ